jgi:hypothetical protein
VIKIRNQLDATKAFNIEVKIPYYIKTGREDGSEMREDVT